MANTYNCRDCAASFSILSQLKRHQQIHTSVGKGETCKYCAKWFPTKSALARHERLHTGDKPFKCEVCDRGFTQKEILKRHMVIHSGQKPFECYICLKQYSQAELLKQHISRKHSDSDVSLPHKCPLCPKVSYKLYSILIHCNPYFINFILFLFFSFLGIFLFEWIE